jgi:RimJ/RimL family protein N-acetyltransferase
MKKISLFKYRPATEEMARQYVHWQYEPPYHIYNCLPDYLDEEIAYQVDPQNCIFTIHDSDGELTGYCSFGHDAQVRGGDYSSEALDIGLMIHPDLTGQGLGGGFVRDVIRFGVDKFRPELLRVTIAGFNKRARRVWEKNGFTQAQTFRRDLDRMEFVILTRAANLME